MSGIALRLSVRAPITLLGALLIVLATGCASTVRQTEGVTQGAPLGRPVVGIASFYANKYHGRKTSSGERYNMHALTAAHRTLPFGSTVKVTNLENDRTVVVRINDRGPFVRGRIIDISLEAARRLQMVAAGTARVKVEPHSSPERAATAPK
jgi:rare lipoprotein A